jgi:hypothetical protein
MTKRKDGDDVERGAGMTRKKRQDDKERADPHESALFKCTSEF